MHLLLCLTICTTKLIQRLHIINHQIKWLSKGTSLWLFYPPIVSISLPHINVLKLDWYLEKHNFRFTYPWYRRDNHDLISNQTLIFYQKNNSSYLIHALCVCLNHWKILMRTMLYIWSSSYDYGFIYCGLIMFM